LPHMSWFHSHEPVAEPEDSTEPVEDPTENP
jgi:hypothetical protein